MCLQRWLSSWIAFVVLWCANYIIYWTSHDATIIAIVEFIIPLLLIPLLASAYAEANTEGQRMIRVSISTTGLSGRGSNLVVALIGC